MVRKKRMLGAIICLSWLCWKEAGKAGTTCRKQTHITTSSGDSPRTGPSQVVKPLVELNDLFGVLASVGSILGVHLQRPGGTLKGRTDPDVRTGATRVGRCGKEPGPRASPRIQPASWRPPSRTEVKGSSTHEKPTVTTEVQVWLPSLLPMLQEPQGQA